MTGELYRSMKEKLWADEHFPSKAEMTAALDDAYEAGKQARDEEMAKAYENFINAFTTKRPQPEVYDADGVKIEVGDTVYLIDGDGTPMKVEYIPNKDNGFYVSIATDKGSYDPDRFTHQKPVFDAQGVRIKEGDTVWLDNHKLRVTGFTDYSAFKVRCEDKNGKSSLFVASYLTHIEPDTREKFDKDFCKFLESMPDGHGYHIKFQEFMKRYAELCNRGEC